MANTIERELTFLAASLPDDLENHEFVQMGDIYVPAADPHPRTRLRRKGERFEITKKIRLDANDAGLQEEHTIPLTEEEYTALAQGNERRVEKDRYFYPYQGRTAEIDIFRGVLQGLVVIDFEFDTESELRAFQKPDFCGADVTQEEFIAGGKLAGREFTDLEPDLARLGYNTEAIARQLGRLADRLPPLDEA